MADKPLLIFPAPVASSRDLGAAAPPNLHHPTPKRQGERIRPKLSALQKAFESRAVEVSQSSVGINPEQVIVIETVGSVENFANAVGKISGLEWLGEMEIEAIRPDDDFYTTNSKSEKLDKTLRGRLYLVMSNQSALSQMLTLWNRYQRTPSMKWPYGLTKFRDVFLHLHDIRRWGAKDRLEESGLLEAWEEDLLHSPADTVRLEIELWYRHSEEVRKASRDHIRGLVEANGGSFISECEISGIAYHSLLAELPRNRVQQIFNDPTAELVMCDSVMFFRPVGQMAAGKEAVEGEAEESPSFSEQPLPTGDPIIAVLDGMPIQNHVLLADRLIVEDPEDVALMYPVRDRCHGTAMCSIVVWGDLSESPSSLRRPVYVRPVMRPMQSWHTTPIPEEMPRDSLPVDLIHRAVRRMFEGEGGESPSAPTVKIINLSIGDPNRPFDQFMSPLARLLDWLSEKYGVLFVVSGGNQGRDIDVGITESDFRKLPAVEQEDLVIRRLFDDARHRRIYSPAESINSLTVNATHQDGSTDSAPGRLINAFSQPLPSPISSFGSGYRRSVKPDITLPGGRILHDFQPGSTVLTCRQRRSAPGLQVAAPGTDAGDVAKTVFGAGTSNAAAVASRTLGVCHDELLSLFQSQAEDIDSSPYLVPILKSLIVHACSWDSTGDRLREVLSKDADRRKVKHWISQWQGYGMPDLSKILECTDQRATLIGFGELEDGAGHLYSLPLPPSLGSTKEKRRLTVSLAWLSPVLPSTQKYRNAGLWFDLPVKRLTPSRINTDHHAARRGTVQHEVFEGNDALVIFDGDDLIIKVNCRADAGKLVGNVRYGLTVSLEVAPGITLPIYNEIQERVRTEVEVRARNPIR